MAVIPAKAGMTLALPKVGARDGKHLGYCKKQVKPTSSARPSSANSYLINSSWRFFLPTH
jgi:hypothetical protein